MIPIRVIAIPTKTAQHVRETKTDPHFGYPASSAPAPGAAPCRHCLQLITPGEEAMLFTFDAFEGVEEFPLPGPVFVHSRECERYPENGEFPPELRDRRTIDAYARGRRLIAEERTTAGNVDGSVQKLLERSDVDYLHIRSTTAGCYTFRIERAG